jgi:LysR family transcriptional regulator, low CO2-responsive transcriptional regulator
MRNATLRQLRVFAAAARHQSFGKAAEELHLTPPAVSMQIRDLEEQVGLPLFDRSGRQVALTVTGEYLLVYVRKVLATLKDAEDAIARFRGLESGRVSIGMVSTAKYFVPRLLAQFRQEHPAIEVKLAVGGNREQLVALLRANEVDLAIMGRPPRELATRAEPFAVHPHSVVATPDHPLMRIGHAPASLLNNYEFIIREPGSGTRAAMEKFFADHRLQPRVAMEMTSNETIKQAVMAGMGVSFLSLHTIGLERRAGLLAVPDIEGLPVLKRWYVVNNLSKTLSPAAEAFRYFILEEGERFLAKEYGTPEAATEAREPA